MVLNLSGSVNGSNFFPGGEPFGFSLAGHSPYLILLYYLNFTMSSDFRLKSALKWGEFALEKHGNGAESLWIAGISA
jgi:hypothetical protein